MSSDDPRRGKGRPQAADLERLPFSHRGCPYYPCHTEPGGGLNCLFCYCPLYHHSDCPGAPAFLPDGRKDCSGCTWPHCKENLGALLEALR